MQFFEKNVGNNCPVSLSYMLKILPAHQILKKILESSSDCTERGWIFLSFDLAEWSFIWFSLFLAVSIFLLVNKKLR